MFDYECPKAGSTKEKIFLTAKKLYFENGIEETSMRALAADADVKLGSITYFFPEKTDLSVMIYSQTCNRMEDFFEKGDDGVLSLHDFFFLELLHMRSILVSPRFYELYRIATAQQKTTDQYAAWMGDMIRRYCHHDKDDTLFFEVIPYLLNGIKKEVSACYRTNAESYRGNTRRFLSMYLDNLIQSIFPPEVRSGFEELDAYRDNLLTEFDDFHVDVARGYTPVFVPISAT